MTVILRPFQQDLKQAIYSDWNQGKQNVLSVLPTGGGKCLGRDTPILMYDGTIRKVQDVKVNDLLMGPDSQPRKVLNVCSGVDQLYEVASKKGSSYIVNSKHVLSLRRTREYVNPKYPCQKRGGEIVNINVKEYIEKSKTFKHIHKGWRTGVDFPNNEDFLIEPYWLGLWLGDGTSRIPTVTTIDPEIINYCREFVQKHNLRIREETKKGTKAINVHFLNKIKNNWTPTLMVDFLRSRNLIRNKHIPLEYKTTSIKNRLELLAGLIDSDGHYTGKGYDFVSVSEKLLDDLIFLCRSLGFAAYKKQVKKTCKNNGVTNTYYRCNISGQGLEKIPVLLERKKANMRRQKKNVLNVGINVKNIGIGEYFGFQITGNDRLFLLGDFTVTHNSVIISDVVMDGVNSNLSQSVIAHRNELVSQMSVHVARRGIPHRIIGPNNVISQISRTHRKMFNGRSFINLSARTAVVGVGTLMSRSEDLANWGKQQDRWIIDEAHHTIRENQWGKAVQMFSNAHGLGVTATPSRADGLGLGREYDGVFDSMVEGPSMRELINMGYLSDYEIVCPKSDIELNDNDIGESGDYSRHKLKAAAEKSRIVGDVLQAYCIYSYGEQAIVFATDINTANKIAAQFVNVGIKAVSLSSHTNSVVREKYVNEFKEGRTKVLINVDLFDEGFDCPAVNTVIMARPTASLVKFLQMIGRGLRIDDGKPYGLLIDMVSNIIRHGLPDKKRIWTLARRDKRAKSTPDPEDIPLTVCKSCAKPYERFHKLCPHCGFEPPLPDPQERTIEVVEGDLVLLDRATLAKMREDSVLESVSDIGHRVSRAAGEFAAKGVMNRQVEKIEAQQNLSDAIAQWAAIQRKMGRDDSESYRRFYIATGMDVLSALSKDKKRQEYEKLTEIVEGWYK